MNIPPIVIWTPSYQELNGGAVALHKLCHDLNCLGANAAVHIPPYLVDKTVSPVNPNYNTPLVDEANRDDIAIYPEIVHGNPLGTNRVTRWLLNTPGVIQGGPTTFSEGDLILAYQRKFHATAPLLTAIDFHEGFFRPPPEGTERKGDCYTIRKGAHKVGATTLNLSTMDHFEQADFVVMRDLFQRHERFYCFDAMSMIPFLAALCGCLPIVIPEPGVSKQEWWSAFPLLSHGIAYGEDDIGRMVSERHRMADNMRAVKADADASQREFLGRLETWK